MTICKDHLGNKYKSYKAMCEKYKISYQVYTWRLNNGYNVEQALTTKLKNSNRAQSVTIDNIKFKSLKEMCKYYGKSWSLIVWRMNKKGMTLEQALKTKVKEYDLHPWRTL